MRYISELKEGSRIQDIYLCKHKQSAVTKNGRNYENVILQDKTGQLDCKIWDPNSGAIGEFEALDYIYVAGSVSNFNGQLQASLKQVRKWPRRGREHHLRRAGLFLHSHPHHRRVHAAGVPGRLPV